MNFDKMGRDLWSSTGMSSSEVDKILEVHEVEMRKYLRNEFHSLDEVEYYAARVQGSMRMALCAAWKKMGPYLCLFFNTEGGVMFGSQPVPLELIVRTGESTWRAYEITKEFRDILARVISTKEELDVILAKEKLERKVEELNRYLGKISGQ